MPVNPDAARYGIKCRCIYSCEFLCEALFEQREFKVTCLGAPLQIEGFIDGVPFYFRARHDKWRLEAGYLQQR
jgi:hypothetical protein